MTIQLHLLGGFRASVDGTPITDLRATAPTRLLAYLALHRSTRPRRVFLAGLFWPEGSELRARRRLSHTLWVLQSALAATAPSLIQADRDTIGLDDAADLWIDAEQFERQIDAVELQRREGTSHLHTATLAQTIALYGGDLLSDHYDDWLDASRLRLREKFLLGLNQLIQIQKSRGDYGAALVSARRLVAETPLAEHAHIELVRLYWLAGRSDEAMAQYNACSDIFTRELGIEPGAQLIELQEQIAAHRGPVMDSLTSDQDTVRAGKNALIGRADSRGRLLDVVDAAFGGSGGFALIEGHAGMGKTRLLQDVAEAARWRGATVVWAKHTEAAILEPYGGVAQGLSAELQGLPREQVLARMDPALLPLAARLLPTLRTGSNRPVNPEDWATPDERYRLQEALAQVLMALSAATPVLMVLDDLQWADQETLEFLRLAAPKLVRSKVAVALSYRTQEARNRHALWQLLTDLEQRHPTVRVPLSGLLREDIAALVNARSIEPMADESISRLEQATGGNPLFVIETMRSVERDPSDPTVNAELDNPATIDRVARTLLREIAAAPPTLQTVVGALAVWGRGISSTTLTRLAGLEITDLLDAIQLGIDSEFITESEGQYQLRFDQLAVAARGHMSAGEAELFHGRAAAVMVEDPAAPAAELAAHYRAAGQWSDAARFEAAAAIRAGELHSYEASARYYELAIKSLENAGMAPTAGLLFGFDHVLEVLTRYEEQARVLDLLRVTDLSLTEQLRLMQRQATWSSNTDEVYEAIRTATAAVGFAIGAELEWGPAVVTLAKVFVMAGRPDLARQHLEGLESGAVAAAGLAGARLALGQALTDVQDFEAAKDHLDTALRLYQAQADTRGQSETLTAIAVLQSLLGNNDTAGRHYHAAIALARQAGSRFGEGMALANLAVLTHLEGNAAASLAHMREAIDVFMAIGHRRGEAMVRANMASVLHGVLGDDEQAERQATMARRYFEEIGDRRHQTQCLDVMGGVRRRRRAHAVSRRLLQQSLEIVRSEHDHWLEVQMLRSLAWTERDAGRLAEAEEAVALGVEISDQYHLETELPILLALLAAILADNNQPERSAAAARRSLLLSDAPCELRHIAAWWRYEAFRALGLEDDAERSLLVAHRQMGDLLSPFTEAERETALTRVTEHAQIKEAFASRFPRTEVVDLPSIESLEAGGATISVTWTVHHPDDLCVSDKRERRSRRLKRILDEAATEGARPRVEDLAGALDTSVSTLKRDLAQLRSQGAIN